MNDLQKENQELKTMVDEYKKLVDDLKQENVGLRDTIKLVQEMLNEC